MALNEVGLLVYSQGFAMSRDEYIIRELAFCDWTGHHHALFKYLLPKGVSYHPLSEEAKTRVDRQTKTVHGLPFEPYTAYNRHDFHPYHQIQDDITRWCQQYLTPPTESARGVHAEWSVSTVPRDVVPPRGLGRAGLPGLGPSSHRHRQCHGHQRSGP